MFYKMLQQQERQTDGEKYAKGMLAKRKEIYTACSRSIIFLFPHFFRVPFLRTTLGFLRPYPMISVPYMLLPILK